MVCGSLIIGIWGMGLKASKEMIAMERKATPLGGNNFLPKQTPSLHY